MNHLPLYKGKLPFHALREDTANPNLKLDCEDCRKLLQNKMEAHREQAARYPVGSHGRLFFTADAERILALLN